MISEPDGSVTRASQDAPGQRLGDEREGSAVGGSVAGGSVAGGSLISKTTSLLLAKNEIPFAILGKPVSMSRKISSRVIIVGSSQPAAATLSFAALADSLMLGSRQGQGPSHLHRYSQCMHTCNSIYPTTHPLHTYSPIQHTLSTHIVAYPLTFYYIITITPYLALPPSSSTAPLPAVPFPYGSLSTLWVTNQLETNQ